MEDRVEGTLLTSASRPRFHFFLLEARAEGSTALNLDMLFLKDNRLERSSMLSLLNKDAEYVVKGVTVEWFAGELPMSTNIRCRLKDNDDTDPANGLCNPSTFCCRSRVRLLT